MDSIINMINEYSILIIIALAVITLLLFIITMLLLASVKLAETAVIVLLQSNLENVQETQFDSSKTGKSFIS